MPLTIYGKLGKSHILSESKYIADAINNNNNKMHKKEHF